MDVRERRPLALVSALQCLLAAPGGPDAGAGNDGGGASSSGGGGPGGKGNDGPATAADDDGCGCRTGPSPIGRFASVAVGVLFLVGILRRRR